MNRLFARWLPCATLATWSAVLLYFYFSGRLGSLLHPMFRPYVLVAGVVLGLMAAIFVIFPADASCCSSAECGHSLSRFRLGKLLTFVILLLPVTVAAFVSPDEFGKTMIQNRKIDTDGSTLPTRARTASAPAPIEMPLPTKDGIPPSVEPAPGATATADAPPAASDYLERTPDGNIVVEILDLLYSAQDATLRKDFEGKKVQLVGQLMHDKTSEAGGAPRFKAVRMFMTCCAADARPVATLVETEKLPDVPEMTWVKIVGTSTFPVENGRRTAVLKAEHVEKTSPPEESMLY